jgi:hypothetical protein
MQQPRRSPFANYDNIRLREFAIEQTVEEVLLAIDVQTLASYESSLLLKCYRNGTGTLDNINYKSLSLCMQSITGP